MATLTPPSVEQCAMIAEAARQATSGETAERYWVWSREATIFNFPLFSLGFDWDFWPAPAHPHYATYCEWQQLVDAGEVAKGWWTVYGCIGFLSCITTEPKWFPGHEYEIRKTDKHPYNAKPSLKLIDWAKFVGLSGLMTSEGVFLGLDKNGNASLMRMIGVFPKCMVVPTDTIKIVEQTTLTHLPAGTPPPVVEGLVFEYEYPAAVFVGTTIKEHVRGHTELRNVPGINAYRVTRLAPGYTDNPKLAK